MVSEPLSHEKRSCVSLAPAHLFLFPPLSCMLCDSVSEPLSCTFAPGMLNLSASVYHILLQISLLYCRLQVRVLSTFRMSPHLSLACSALQICWIRSKFCAVISHSSNTSCSSDRCCVSSCLHSCRLRLPLHLNLFSSFVMALKF